MFFDVRDIKTGDAWNDDLILALRTSKCLIPFVSLDYFGSHWCRAEFETFRLRRAKLIFPIAVHTAGGRLKERQEFSNLQYLDVQKYHYSSPVFWQNPALVPEFEALLRAKANHIFALVEGAPLFRSDFPLVHPDAHVSTSTRHALTKSRPAPRTRAKRTGVSARKTSEKLPTIFLNTPQDESYRPMLEAMLFTVISCGFVPRSMVESADESNTLPRLDQAFKLIRESQFSIHDLASGTRGNVLLETGMLLGVARLTPSKAKFLIIDNEPHEYRKFLSDLSGQDILFHKGDRQAIVAHVRNWLSVNSRTSVSSSAQIWKDYRSFRDALPSFAEALKVVPDEVSFRDLVQLMHSWREHSSLTSV